MCTRRTLTKRYGDIPGSWSSCSRQGADCCVVLIPWPQWIICGRSVILCVVGPCCRLSIVVKCVYASVCVAVDFPFQVMNSEFSFRSIITATSSFLPSPNLQNSAATNAPSLPASVYRRVITIINWRENCSRLSRVHKMANTSFMNGGRSYTFTNA